MDILLKGIISGCVVMCVLWIARLAGPRAAGVISMVPVVSAFAYLFVIDDLKTLPEIQTYVVAYMMGALLYVPFCGAIYLLNKATGQFYFSFGLGYLAWGFGAALYIYFGK